VRFRWALGLLAAATVLPGCPGGADPDFIPAPPDGLAATPLSTSTAQVVWNDLSDNEAGFIVETSPDNLVWADNTAVSFNATTAVATGLIPGAQVFIRVSSLNAKGRSTPAGPVAITPPLPAWTSLGTGPNSLFWTCSAYDPTRRLMLVFGGQDDLLASSNTLYALTLNGAPPTWSTIAPANTPPTARFGSSLVYDPLKDRLILFGGKVGAAAVAEIWEFKMATSQWFSLATSGTAPSARQHHSAVYDAGHGRMVVYGGENGSVFAPDALALTLPAAGTPAWSTFTLSGLAPTARTRHSAIYDGAARRMVVFGGFDSDLADGSILARDTWSVDLVPAAPTAWTPITVSGGPPSFREGHLTVWDSIGQQMVVYGGLDDATVANADLWTLSLAGTATWRQLALGTSAGDRAYGAAVFDPVLNRIIVFGGIFDDTFVPLNDAFSLRLGL
jgi:hypothetical protein